MTSTTNRKVVALYRTADVPNKRPLPPPGLTYRTHELDQHGSRRCSDSACVPGCRYGESWPTLRIDPADDEAVLNG